MEEKPQGSEQLFAVFFLSIYSLFVIPYTIYKLCLAASPDEVVKPWEAVRAPRHLALSSSVCLTNRLPSCGVLALPGPIKLKGMQPSLFAADQCFWYARCAYHITC